MYDNAIYFIRTLNTFLPHYPRDYFNRSRLPNTFRRSLTTYLFVLQHVSVLETLRNALYTTYLSWHHPLQSDDPQRQGPMTLVNFLIVG